MKDSTVINVASLTFVENFVKRAKRSLESKVDLRSARRQIDDFEKKRERSHLLFFTHDIFKHLIIKHASIRCFEFIVKSIDFMTCFQQLDEMSEMIKIKKSMILLVCLLLNNGREQKEPNRKEGRK